MQKTHDEKNIESLNKNRISRIDFILFFLLLLQAPIWCCTAPFIETFDILLIVVLFALFLIF